MASIDVDVHHGTQSQTVHAEAPITLDERPTKSLGFFDQVGLWANLGVSLLGFTGAMVVLQPLGPDTPELPLGAALLATIVGTLLGTAAVGLAAVPGARTGAPAMVLLRGLFGARLSYLPTVLNILQLLGWGTFEIVVISSAAHQVAPGLPMWSYKLIAGAITTGLALRPLGAVRVLRKYVTVAVVIVLVYLFVQLLRQPMPAVPNSSWHSFWPAVDATLAVAVSLVPVAADFTRLS
jgi:purine-cytosine permease-like protein